MVLFENVISRLTSQEQISMGLELDNDDKNKFTILTWNNNDNDMIMIIDLNLELDVWHSGGRDRGALDTGVNIVQINGMIGGKK